MSVVFWLVLGLISTVLSHIRNTDARAMLQMSPIHPCRKNEIGTITDEISALENQNLIVPPTVQQIYEEYGLKIKGWDTINHSVIQEHIYKLGKPTFTIPFDGLIHGDRLIFSDNIEATHGFYPKVLKNLERITGMHPKIFRLKLEKTIYNIEQLLNGMNKRGDRSMGECSFGSSLNLSGAINDLGVVNMALGAHNKAIQAFRRALFVDPKNHVVWSNVAAVMYQYGFDDKGYFFGLRAVSLRAENKAKADHIRSTNPGGQNFLSTEISVQGPPTKDTQYSMRHSYALTTYSAHLINATVDDFSMSPLLILWKLVVVLIAYTLMIRQINDFHSSPTTKSSVLATSNEPKFLNKCAPCSNFRKKKRRPNF
eukprot:TRINITY_DN96492_c0_g1_i1.p1 TRINITY_DN96492_c0_g1~~TRINITY_DN96492_c0_g1_i1.p1  ORF type:complete len:369 (+),score=59.18 TRINITY_DN96492_c0_g1_i1:124-1230(+)